ncbi:carbohydrate-binding protein [Chitinilyticum piscinae]|uniref:Chitin-binding type-3 domain-containing protein n=1 Tax=Chitinilyticum piscinae TaxID=2866724 RepID=A0A8J7FPS6_9NEIS|nr:carbohydrate-binding protein [Chitinilyticum piscinae]MBE9608361.1 hypothetical protein [Chitinilyticum piscinae]
MNHSLKAFWLCGGLLLASAAAQACSPPPISPPPRPVGLDGKLPVTYPEISATPTPSPIPCPVKSYGYTASMPSLSDAESDKLGIPGGSGLSAPAWDSAKIYNGGELASYNGQVYKAKWWTQNEAPGNAYGAWELQASGSGPQPWDKDRIYNAGDQAVFQAGLYRAKWWTQGNTPGDQWGPWESLGPAPVAPATGRPAPYSVFVQQETRPSGEVVLHVSHSSYLPHRQIRYYASNDCTVATSESYIGNGSGTPPERWEIRMDGKVVTTVSASQFLQFLPRPVATLPPDSSRFVMRDSNGVCQYAPGTTLFTWDGFNGAGTGVTVMIPKGNGTYWNPQSPDQYLSTWACNGDACRPSTLLWHTRMGTMAW